MKLRTLIRLQYFKHSRHEESQGMPFAMFFLSEDINERVVSILLWYLANKGSSVLHVIGKVYVKHSNQKIALVELAL